MKEEEEENTHWGQAVCLLDSIAQCGVTLPLTKQHGRTQRKSEVPILYYCGS
jgi:hypothetical protein